MRPAGYNRFVADLDVKVGPVRASFSADILLRDVVPPRSYRLEAGVKGGVAGFAKGCATVRLDDLDGAATMLNYRIEGAVGGKLARIGSRLVAVAARKMVAGFFARFVVDFAETSGRFVAESSRDSG